MNLPLYTRKAIHVIGLDPSPKLLSIAERSAYGTALTVQLVEGTAEALPLEDPSIDTVVTTWTLCSIPNVERALREMRRVLRPDGRLLFVEHEQATDRAFADGNIVSRRPGNASRVDAISTGPSRR